MMEKNALKAFHNAQLRSELSLKKPFEAHLDFENIK